MSGSYPNLLAKSVTVDATFLPFELWAGEADLVTSQGTAGATVQQFQVIMRGGTGGTQLVPWDGTLTVTTRPVGFAAQPAVANGPIAYYTGGVPNHQALIWPAGTTTLDARKAAFDGTNITVSAIL